MSEEMVYVERDGKNMDELDEMKSVGEIEAAAAEPKPADEGKPEEGATAEGNPEEANPAENEEKPAEEPPKVEEHGSDPYGKPGHTPSGVQKRFNEITRDNHDLRSRNEALEARVAELENQLKPNREPTKEDFLKAGKTEDDYFQYRVDKAARQQVETVMKEQEAARERNEDARKFNESEENARKIFDDYDSVVYGSNPVKGTSAMIDFLCRCEGNMGADVIYAVSKYPDARSAFDNATTEAEKMQVLKNVHAHMLRMSNEAKAKRGASNPPASNQPQAAAVPAAQPAQSQTIREPGKIPSGGQSAKRLNPSDCSMEEWMENGY